MLLSFAHWAWSMDAHGTVDDMLRQANARVARGEPPDAVEKSLREGMERQGMATQGEPPAWDVFARARWRREEAPAVETPDPDQHLSATPQASFVTSVNPTTQ